MFLKVIDYVLSPGEGAYIYEHIHIDKKCYFDKIHFDTVEEMECLLDTLQMIKDKNNLDTVMEKVKEKIELRKLGIKEECEYRRKKWEEGAPEREKHTKITIFCEHEKYKTQDVIMKLRDKKKNNLSEEEVEKLVHQEIDKYNAKVKDFIVSNYGEEEYNKRLSKSNN